jgi:hypothetical protein
MQELVEELDSAFNHKKKFSLYPLHYWAFAPIYLLERVATSNDTRTISEGLIDIGFYLNDAALIDIGIRENKFLMKCAKEETKNTINKIRANGIYEDIETIITDNGTFTGEVVRSNDKEIVLRLDDGTPKTLPLDQYKIKSRQIYSSDDELELDEDVLENMSNEDLKKIAVGNPKTFYDTLSELVRKYVGTVSYSIVGYEQENPYPELQINADDEIKAQQKRDTNPDKATAEKEYK